MTLVYDSTPQQKRDKEESRELPHGQVLNSAQRSIDEGVTVEIEFDKHEAKEKTANDLQRRALGYEDEKTSES
jgi:hypothetical protein